MDNFIIYIQCFVFVAALSGGFASWVSLFFKGLQKWMFKVWLASFVITILHLIINQDSGNIRVDILFLMLVWSVFSVTFFVKLVIMGFIDRKNIKN